MNRLYNEKSAYLRHSASQKIDWYPWCDEAFERAKQEDKPVFLSSGGIWCHWCHVMAKECFEEEEIVNLLNENFINIKIDRDERPDIDRRYQQAVVAMGFGGGWPLSVFLTPDKKPFFGGTYFPPEDGHGRPSFRKVLKEVSNYYKSKREEISEFTDRLIEFMKPKPLSQGEIQESLIEEGLKNILCEYDSQDGGFGRSPKFHMSGAVQFLINRYFFNRSESIGYAVKKTLESMAKGGLHDQLEGGFHRYSTDRAWIIPHFEKMADDNAWLLRNYIEAYRLFGDEYFKEVAEGIINFLKKVLSDPEGGFYASQDADVTPDDEGGYFTWSAKDFKEILTDDEYKVISMHFLNERGSMHHDESKKVLFVAMEAEDISRKIGVDIKTVKEIINFAKGKLLSARKRRQIPFIDSTFYTSLNGMAISAFLHAYRILKDPWLKDFSLKSLGRIMSINFNKNVLFHSEGVRAVLDDYIYMVEAFISAYEVTGEVSYLERADELMEICISKLWDQDDGGFFDSENTVLEIRLKSIEDIPHPSANSISIIQMLKLYHMTKKDKYYEYAEKALKIFSLKAKDIGILSGYYFCAMDAYHNMLSLTLDAIKGSELVETALSSFRPYTSMVYPVKEVSSNGSHPVNKVPSADKGSVTPCIRGVCMEPINNPVSLRDFLERKQERR